MCWALVCVPVSTSCLYDRHRRRRFLGLASAGDARRKLATGLRGPILVQRKPYRIPRYVNDQIRSYLEKRSRADVGIDRVGFAIVSKSLLLSIGQYERYFNEGAFQPMTGIEMLLRMCQLLSYARNIKLFTRRSKLITITYATPHSKMG
jgi:hypothetical protein